MIVIRRTVPIETEPEINALLKHLRQWNPNYYVAAMIGIAWGLRCSDILSLKIGDVIAGLGKRIQISDRVIVREQKTGHERYITVHEKMKDTLYEHIKRRVKYDGELDLSAPLVLSRKRAADGKPRAPSRQHLSWVINTAAKKVGIRGSIGTHGLRKTFVFQAWMRNVGVDVLQKMLGHSSVAVTHRYACIPESFEAEVYRKVNFGFQPSIKRTQNRNGFERKKA